MPLSLPAVEVREETAWLVLMPSGQAGPYSAAGMAQLFDQANVDWTSLVWRAGLKGWRPARRDPQLITAVASARGSSAWGDTQRVPVRRVSLPATDTLVEAPPGLSVSLKTDAFSTVTQHDWAEDTGDQSTQVAARASLPKPALTVAFRGAPSVTEAAAILEPPAQPVTQRRSSPNSWLPSAQSMSIVAVVAFGFGVSVAALWGRAQRVVTPHSATTVLVRPAPVTEPLRAVPSAPPDNAFALHRVAAQPSHETPTDAELKREVKRVSPDIRRCVDDLSRGAEVEVYFDGVSGRARDVRLRTSGLSPGRVECITEAARQMQVDPFSRPTHKYWHRFSY